ncbi:MAG: hypothetical protein LBR10_03990 [Prevotellaceae bacterium]|jgi:tricorn protease|nr:hypothetical protein [Prevotellaceae bacterium]
MINKIFVFIFFLLASGLTKAQDSLFFATQPAISPDAKEIYFCYDGGIWKTPVAGGTASRVTAMTGYQTNPKISPDGKWLAFSSDEQGNANVYVTPVSGGTIRQLTFHEGYDKVSSWSHDSKYVYFESNRYNMMTTYRVSIDGGTPQRLFTGYFNTIVNLVEDPDGVFYFNESSESFVFPTRKGYRGDNNPDIKSWNPAKKEYRQLTTHRGKDIWSSTDKKGRLYWATDERNGEYNLACLEKGKPRILTGFTTGIQQPQVSYNGEKVVFVKDYVICLYDVASGKTSMPQIKVYERSLPDITRSYATEGNISECDISPDGKKIAFVSRGQLFISDTKGLFIRRVNTDPKERVVELSWAKDNKTIYYTRTREGWYNLYKISAEERFGEKLVYTPNNMVKNLTVGNDRSLIAFVTGSDRLELLRCETDKVEKLDNNEFWSFQNYNMAFSSDDKYLAYTGMNLFERDVFIYDFAAKKSFNLTNSASMDDSPAWSSDGKYLYLTANRYAAAFPKGTRGNLFRIKLNHSDTPYTTDKYRELFQNDSVKKANEAKNKTDISFELEDIQRRWEPVQSSGNQSWVKILKNGAKSYLLYSSNHEGGQYGVYVQEIVDFDSKPPKKINELTFPASFSYNGKDLYVIQQGNVYSIDLGGASAKKIDLKQNFVQNNGNEFRQMFHEVWALLSENFYDPKFHGVDWKKKRDYYSRFLPHVKSRRDFRTMMEDMLGELNSSHLGFSSSGSEEHKATSIRSTATGILFDNLSPYTVASVLKESPAYLAENKVAPGDELIAVNGVAVDRSRNREYYFASPVSEKETTLTFRRGQNTFDLTLHTVPANSLNSMFYTAWEDDCRKRVKEKTGGRVAYHHMRDMGAGALNSFLIDMSTEAVHKDALILDLRYNNGGNVHDEVLNYLCRKPYFTWKYRNYQSNTHPNVIPGAKPVVVLINERSLSDAEVTSNGIRSLGIGKLIGTETYRWIIFTSGAMLVDGSFCRLPSWGCYNLKNEDMESAGVKPDIYVKNTFEDRLNGNDPQLDKAIEEILKDMAIKNK